MIFHRETWLEPPDWVTLGDICRTFNMGRKQRRNGWNISNSNIKQDNTLVPKQCIYIYKKYLYIYKNRYAYINIYTYVKIYANNISYHLHTANMINKCFLLCKKKFCSRTAVQKQMVLIHRCVVGQVLQQKPRPFWTKPGVNSTSG